MSPESFSDADTERLDTIALALTLLDFGKLPPYCMRYVLDKAGVIAPITINHESFKFTVAGEISRWPTDEELYLVRRQMQNVHSHTLSKQLVKDACRSMKKG